MTTKKTWIIAGIAVGPMILLFLFVPSFFALLIAAPILAFLVVYFFLAPNDLFFTFVKEGEAKAIMKAGEFNRCIMSWAGHAFKKQVSGNQPTEEENWEIISMPNGETRKYRHFLGGLRWVGIWPIYTIHEYKWSWAHLSSDGTEKKHVDELLRHVLVKTDAYAIRNTPDEAFEDIYQLGLRGRLIIPIRVTNPYTALFRFQNWFALVAGVARSSLKEFLAGYRYRDQTAMVAGRGLDKDRTQRGLPLVDPGVRLIDELWKVFVEATRKEALDAGSKIDSSEKEFKAFGVCIERQGMRIDQIDPTDEKYRDLTQAPIKAELEGEARVITAQKAAQAAQHEADRDAIQSGGLFIGIMAQLEDKTPKQAAQLLRKNKELREVTIQFAREMAEKQALSNKGTFFEVSTIGNGRSGGNSKKNGFDIADLVALMITIKKALDMIEGRTPSATAAANGSGSVSTTEKKSGRKKPEEMTSEELVSSTDNILKRGFS